MNTFVAKSLLALGLSAVVLAAPAIAQTPANLAGREPVTIEFRYKGWDTPAENYRVVQRLVKRACVSPGPKTMVTWISENECSAEMMDAIVSKVGRLQIAQIHFNATGRLVSPGLQLASNLR